MGFPFKTKATPTYVTLTTKNNDYTFEVESRGDITVKEDIRYNELLQEYNVGDETRLLLELAALISREKGINSDQALKVIIPPSEPMSEEEREEEVKNAKLRAEYTGHLAQLSQDIVVTSASKALFGAYIISPRLLGPLEERLREIKKESNGLPYNAEQKEEVSLLETQIEEIKGYTLDSIKELPKQVVDELAKFFNKESSGEKSVEVDPDSGKSPAPSQTKSSTTDDEKQLTGEVSSGESNDSGQQTNDSTQTDSETNPVV